MERLADILERKKSNMYGYLPWYYYFVTIIINIIIIYLNVVEVIFSKVSLFSLAFIPYIRYRCLFSGGKSISSKKLFIIIIIIIITLKNKNKKSYFIICR